MPQNLVAKNRPIGMQQAYCEMAKMILTKFSLKFVVGKKFPTGIEWSAKILSTDVQSNVWTLTLGISTTINSTM
jgi:hypothetical protein